MITQSHVSKSKTSLLKSAVALFLLVGSPGFADDAPQVTVYKTPTCGCCGKWIKHLEASGFDVTAREMDDLSAIKARYQVESRFSSCHTAVVDGYVVEGHVPADLIFRLLKERPENIVGITVPGMPAGSPGMETGFMQPYEVLTFDADGNTSTFATRGLEADPNVTRE
jgi:hypothetical protein